MTIDLELVGDDHDGALVTLALAKSYLRIPAADETQDVLLGALISGVEALFAAEIGGSLASVEVTERVTTGPRDPALRLTNLPVASVSAVVDPDGAEWDSDGFVIAGAHLRQAVEGTALRFGGGATEDVAGRLEPLQQGTWEVTYTGGLENRHDWLTAVKPALSKQALMEIADAYDNRDPRATSERANDQAHNLDQSSALSPRAVALCAKYRVP